jgi:hypothetical protein
MLVFTRRPARCRKMPELTRSGVAGLAVGYSSPMRRSTLLTLLAVAAFAAFLLYSTLTSQRAQCAVTVEYEGRRNDATASAATEREAEQQARTTACGPLAAGMDATIACTNRAPVKRECRTL